MANVLLAYPNLTDTATLSGGAWLATLPLTNLQDARHAKKARSIDDANASTLVNIDLGSDKFVRAVGIIGHNLTLASATIRVRIGNDSAFVTENYDSGAVALNAVIYPPGILITGDPGESDDKLPQAEYDLGYPFDYFDIFNSNGQYLRIDFDDTANADTFVEFGRLWIAFGWQPTINMRTGAAIGWETSSTRTETDGGVTFHNERPRRRFVNLSLVNADEDEALVRSFELHRRQGTHDPILFCYDPDDTFHLHRRTFIATLRELNPLAVPYSNYADTNISLIEEL